MDQRGLLNGEVDVGVLVEEVGVSEGGYLVQSINKERTSDVTGADAPPGPTLR